MIFVESQKELDLFIQQWDNYPSTIYPVWVDLEKHPLNNDLSFLYIYFQDEQFVIGFNHVDCQPFQVDLSLSTQPKRVFGKKKLLQTGLKIKNLKDISAEQFFLHNKTISERELVEKITNFYTRLGIHQNLGGVVPIMKWCEILKDFCSQYHSSDFPSLWVDDKVIPLLSVVERYGIGVVKGKFLDRFPNSTKHLNGTTIYTEYNPYTITSRPSNRHGGINYSALNKGDGTREIFVPKKDHIFIQMDFEAYHPRLIGKLVGYDLPYLRVHQWLASQYGTTIEEGKKITFRLLYGGIDVEFEEIEYFQKVNQYINWLWEKSNRDGYLETKYRKIPIEWIEDVNPQKLFNYLLQATETEYNMEKMESVLSYIKNTRVELTLYTYDSFLFSYPVEDDTTHALKLKEILEEGGFPIKVSWGADYSRV
jgi:hypothetical protein